MLILTIWPLFALILLGFALQRIGVPEPGFWPAAERINYVLFFPALLVASLADAPLSDPGILRLGGAIVAAILFAAAMLWAARRVCPVPAARFGPSLQGAIRFNTYLGLAIAGSLLGAEGLTRAAVLLAIAVPLVNVLSVMALGDAGGRRGAWRTLRPILTNPLILGCAIGIAIAVSGLGLPFGTMRLLDLVAQASLPLGLLCVGAALRPRALGRELSALAGISALRLVAMPCLGALVAAIFGLDEAETLIVVIFTSIPTAAAAYVLTQQMGGDGRLMSGIITAQTMASVVTIPVMLALLT